MKLKPVKFNRENPLGSSNFIVHFIAVVFDPDFALRSNAGQDLSADRGCKNPAQESVFKERS
jgi:hypothetical protein